MGMNNIYLPEMAEIVSLREETPDTKTLALRFREADRQQSFQYDPGQFAEISVFGAFASNIPQYVQARDYIAAGKFDPDKFITAKFPLDDLVSNIEQSQGAAGLKMVALPQL